MRGAIFCSGDRTFDLLAAVCAIPGTTRHAPGKASGLVYGVSTLGNIAGVMLTTFKLIPSFPVSTLLYVWLGVAVLCVAGLLVLLRPTPSS